MYRYKIKYVLVLALCAGLLSAISGTASAAGELNLTAPDSSGWINNAWFVQGLYDNTPSGTGVWLPFLHISAKGNATTEHGYNTDGTLEFDTQDQWTSSLLLDAVEIHEMEVTI